MGFLDALFEPRAVDASQFPIGDGLWTSITDSGKRVDTTSAMRLVAVYACVTLIADAIRAMPVDVYRNRGEVREPVDRKPKWLTQPNPEQTWGQFIDYASHSLLTSGNAFVALTGRDDLNFVTEMFVVHPDDVKVNRVDHRKTITANGKPMREFTASNPSGDLLHILGHTSDGLVGLSPVEQARQAIGSGLAIEEFGNRFFSNGAVTSATVELPAGSVPTPEQLEQLGSQFNRKHAGLKNAWKPIVLANGATYKPMTVPNDQAQFIESAKLSIAEIARLYRVPPHLIGDVERSTSWGTGIEQQGIGFVTYTLLPWLVRFEEALSQLLPRGQFVKFNVNGLLRGDAKDRAQFYQTMAQIQALTVNEIRALEELPPLDGGDTPPPPPNASPKE